MDYAQHVQTKVTPQTQPIPGSTQRPNEAGGFSFQVDDWVRLERFLILGNEGGTYYTGERELTVANAEAVGRCLAADWKRTIRRITDVSAAGRAPKQDPAIFALALATVAGRQTRTTEQAADLAGAFHAVVRTGYHLQTFAAAVDQLRGWGRGLRNLVAGWFRQHEPRDLAYQVLKYQSRNGWSMRDLMRLSHYNRHTHHEAARHRGIYQWVTKGWEGVGEDPHPDEALRQIWAFERAKVASLKEVIHLIRAHNLPREAVPTQYLAGENAAGVWEALLERMPATAMIRNLGNMTRCGLLAPMSDGTRLATTRLADAEWLRRARVHPLQLLVALLTYQQGHGERGQNRWTPVSQVCDALDAAIYTTFAHLTPTGKRFGLGLDVSGSMQGTNVAGLPYLSAHKAQAMMALVTATAERHNFWALAYDTNLYSLTISPRQRLDDVVRLVERLGGGGTDCALPILQATADKVPVDVFVIYTDSQTWAGGTHPVQALRAYRERTGIPAKLVTVAMASNKHSLTDNTDAGMMDVVGFDTNVPALIEDFARN